MKGILLSIAIVAIIVVPLFAVVFYVVGSFALALVASIILAIYSVWMGLLPRMRMERRAKELLAKIPEHDTKIIYLGFASIFPNAKIKVMNSKIAEIEQDGWTFLKASEAGLRRTSFSLGGGCNLHFIREITKSSASAS